MVTLFIFSEILLFSLLKKRQQLLDTFNSNSRLNSKMGLLIKKCVVWFQIEKKNHQLISKNHQPGKFEFFRNMRTPVYFFWTVTFLFEILLTRIFHLFIQLYFRFFRCTQWRQVFSCFPGIVVLKHFTILWFHKKHSSIFERDTEWLFHFT